MKEESATEVANKILAEYLEGKSFYFIKGVCEDILNRIDIMCILPASSED